MAGTGLVGSAPTELSTVLATEEILIIINTCRMNHQNSLPPHSGLCKTIQIQVARLKCDGDGSC